MRAFLDANVIVRHLTQDPPDMGHRATAFLAQEEELLVPDLIVAEVVYVLESFYRVPRSEVAEAVRSLIGWPTVQVVDARLLLRAIEVYEVAAIDFADAYLIASAEITDVGLIVSFDRDLDRISTVRRLEP